jgi:hypothetical protein
MRYLPNAHPNAQDSTAGPPSFISALQRFLHIHRDELVPRRSAGGRRTSRPIRRILCPAVSRPPAAAIHLGLALPTGSSGLPAGSGEQPSNACAGHHLAAAALLGLAPGGVYRATPVTRGAGELLPHRFTLTGTVRSGGLFSVALSRGSPRVAVNNHPALRSPDVPRRRPEAPTRPPGRLVRRGSNPTSA